MSIATTHAGPVHLILSDVVMPGMNGPDIVDRIRERFGAAKALFMSGYADHAALRAGGLSSGLNFIQKPFAPQALAKKVREVLDA